tara:strand:+ start:5414 stop:6538 length:1125 start_codon:yes stop_codon:yes gene_type:complete
MFQRTLSQEIANKLHTGKAIIIIGPRQVGKTTLIKELLHNQSFLFLDADDPVTQNILTSPSTEQLRSLIGENKTLFIDEAQRIPGIGVTLKIITDQFKHVQLLVSGSSSFELTQAVNEPLTGRKWEYQLYPISWEEFENFHGYLNAQQQFENRLIYGFYPDVLNNQGQEKAILNQLTTSYLFKDILAFSEIRKPEVLEKLVQALALQVGNQVSNNELSKLIGIDAKTIAKYIDVLQQAYVIFKLPSFSRNIRNEIKRSKKVYFYDNGIRNAVIGNFNSLNLRQDKGALWENFLISERLKQNAYKNTYAKMHFWRTKQKQEVDLVEEVNGELTGYEFKWKAKPNARLPKTFTEGYQAKSAIIDTTNFREFVKIAN